MVSVELFHITIYLGDAVNEGIKSHLPRVSFGYEANGIVYIHLEENSKEIERFTGFNDKWHNVKIFMDNVYDRTSVILDGKLMFESVPRLPMAYFSPALSFAVGPGNGNEVDIDDVSVSAFYSQEECNKGNSSSYPRPYALDPRPFFTEDFEQLKGKNSIENSGWQTKGKQVLESEQMESESKTLSIQPVEGEQVTFIKVFNVPIDFPFDISDNTFEIRYNEGMYTDTAAYDVYPGHGGSGVFAGNFYSSSSNTSSNSTPGISRTSELFNTYYIYTFDGKLLAEYDHNGNCVRDYIYFGNRLLAEYKPQTNEYFYYMTDQINSARIITNDNGDVVFSEAYGPYGDVQKTWVNTYDPKLKFSGKEREGYSDLDYFGARYYDHKSYRFNSVDPIINKTEALYNPQLWNLYAYCNNNPITYYDPDGRLLFVAPWLLNPATIAAITAAAAAGAIATHNLVKSIDIDEVVEDVIEADIAVVTTGLDIFASSLPMNSAKLAEILKKDDAKSEIRKKGTDYNPDGTEKTAAEQLGQIENAQKRFRKNKKSGEKNKEIESIKKSRSKWKNEAKGIKNEQDAKNKGY